jgi:hypothetical protein
LGDFTYHYTRASAPLQPYHLVAEHSPGSALKPMRIRITAKQSLSLA